MVQTLEFMFKGLGLRV